MPPLNAGPPPAPAPRLPPGPPGLGRCRIHRHAGCVGLAYIRHPGGDVLTRDMVRAGSYEVNVGGRLYPAAIHLRPPYDPEGERVKGREP